MEEKDIRALGLTKDADVRRAMSLVTRLKQEHRQMSLEMDALYIDPDTQDMRTWLDRTHSDVSAVDQQMNSAKKERAANELSQRGVDVTDPRILELMRAAVAANRS